MKPYKSKYKLVQIGWADAISNEDGWHTVEDALKWVEDDNWVVHQIGWILKDAKEYILLASIFNEASAGREETYSGLFKIPKPWILYKKEIKLK